MKKANFFYRFLINIQEFKDVHIAKQTMATNGKLITVISDVVIKFVTVWSSDLHIN